MQIVGVCVANFVDHAGKLTERCLLGDVALRAGRKLLWDGAIMKVTSDEDANRLLHREYPRQAVEKALRDHRGSCDASIE
jgi:hypothetical protein